MIVAVMSNMTKYFIEKMKKFDYYGQLYFKTIAIDHNTHKRLWVPEDIKENVGITKNVIVGINEWSYFNISKDDEPRTRSYPFRYEWSKFGIFGLEFSEIKDNSPLDMFLENIFTQLLALTNNGYNVFLGRDMFIEKNSTYNHIMNIDMMVE